MFRREFIFSSFTAPLFSLLGIKSKETPVVDLNQGPIGVKFPDGILRFYKDGKPHRDGDKPAVIFPNGTLYFYKDGKFHRDGDKPAIIYPDGTLHFYKNGKLHRDGDKPAVIHSDYEKLIMVN